MAGGYSGSSPSQRGLATLLAVGINAGLVLALAIGMPGVAMQPVRDRIVTGFNLPTHTHGGEPADGAAVPAHLLRQRPQADDVTTPALPIRPVHVESDCFELCLDDRALAALVPNLGEDWVRPPVPLTHPATWLRPEDVPPFEGGSPGVRTYRLVVGSDGSVADCALLGLPSNDWQGRAICRAIVSRARFEPAQDHHGNAMTGEFVGTVRWDLAGLSTCAGVEPC